MVSVKTAHDVPKNKVFDVIEALSEVRVQAPVRIGDVVLANVCGTGVDVVATYSLGMNAKWLIRAGFGVAFIYDELLVPPNAESSDLTFVPLEPRIESRHGLVWRKALLTRQAQVFLDALRSEIAPD
jgi:hypothetical protein